MNILIFSQFAGSKQHGMVLRNYNWALEWIKQGHNVTIVASSFAHVRNIQPKVSKQITEEWIDGIRYIWILGRQYSQAGKLGRVLSMLSYTVKSLWVKRYLGVHYDIVIASSPHPFCIYPAFKVAKAFRAKLVYDVRDLWPLTLVFLGNTSPKHPFIWLMQQAENFACKHVDLVTAVPKNCEEYLKKHGLRENRFLSISNGVILKDKDEEAILPEQHQNLLDKLKSEKCFTLAYTGTLGLANAVHVIIQALLTVPNNIHLIIVGQGACQSSLEELSIKLGLRERTHFLPSVQNIQVKEILKQVDLAYVGAHYSPLYKYGASFTKVNDYMLAKKPILYAVGDPQNSVELSGAGISCEAENVEEISAALRFLAQLPKDDLMAMGEKGYTWCVENQLVSTQVRQILDKLFPK